MKEKLHSYLNRYATFSENEIDLIYENLEVKTFLKKEFLLKENSRCTYKYFILKGVVRSFYNTPSGKEKITQFAIDNWWVTNMESFVSESPSKQAIQAIENTDVLCLSKKALEKLYIKLPKLERVFRIIAENMLIAVQRKNDVFLQMKSRERYFDFITKLPNFAQRVPQYMLASYLEISPEYLSEIRKNT
ncbi:cAMP-binding proteins - catabolite gene activator and regulatory subunit of cAMP-dependent protein kinases [Tenacibaculum sp. 190130A14a]|uniref:CRP-like cAMP-binding protein n=1 Tax=Tenacibaculum polynesiense TaxID=3137857 RepID=A0ABP1F4N2_9FLAO